MFHDRRMNDDLRDAARYAALGHPLRLQVLGSILRRPASATEVARELGRAVSTVAHHVAILETRGLIRVVTSRQVRAVRERVYAATEAAAELVGDAQPRRAAVLRAIPPPDSEAAGPTGAAAATPGAPVAVPNVRRSPVALSASSQAGVIRFIHYGFMPNRLGYCGPDENRRLFDHAVAGEVDRSLFPSLARFLGPLPYLRAIAAGAGIPDVFDDRVVEAYWIGNGLLDTFASRELHDALRERLRRQLPPRIMDLVADKVPAGALPHHSFHVLDVWLRLGRLDGNVVATLDNCRVSAGTVTSVEGATVGVERRPLVLRAGKLALGRPESVYAARLIDGRGFVTDLAPGDLVSLHWGWVCERLSARQAAALDRYTRHHLRLANRTL